MRSPVALAIAVVCAAGAAPRAAPQAPVRTSVQVTAVAAVEERTALTVSTPVLTFVVREDGSPATAALDFSAGVRTRPGREVLIVGRVSDADGLSMRFASDGHQETGRLTAGDPAVLARWSGGGRRDGRIVFTLEDAAPGIYSVPIQLTVSVP